MDKLVERTQAALQSGFDLEALPSEKIYIIPPDRTRYLAEIAEESDRYAQWVDKQAALARQAYQLKGTIELLKNLKR